MNVENYRQKERAVQIFGHGFQSDKKSERNMELKLLALYLRDECLMKPREIEAHITAFCQQYCEDYHFRAYYKMIEGACKYAANKENVLIQINSLPVYQSEVEYIDSLDLPYEHKKVMFTILMMKKLDKECFEQRRQGGEETEYKMGYLSADDDKLRFLKKTSGAASKTDIPRDIFYYWREAGFIRVSYAGFVLNFMDQMDHAGAEVMKVEHFDCFGSYWDLLFKGQHMGLCKVCSKPFRKSSGNQCFCKEHGGHREAAVIHKAKQVICDECGHLFFVSSHAAKAKLCPPCARKDKCTKPETVEK